MRLKQKGKNVIRGPPHESENQVNAHGRRVLSRATIDFRGRGNSYRPIIRIFGMKKLIRIPIEDSVSEAPGIVNFLLGLSSRHRAAMLTVLGLDVDSTTQCGIHNDLEVRVPWIGSQRIAVFTVAGGWSWKPLGRDETPAEGEMVGVAPHDFCIYLRVDRRVSWESDQIPLDDAAEGRFVGSSLRSLFLFMGLNGSVDSSWLHYLSRHPERLDEDLEALREELSEGDLS
jgi:hypothetical protein